MDPGTMTRRDGPLVRLKAIPLKFSGGRLFVFRVGQDVGQFQNNAESQGVTGGVVG